MSKELSSLEELETLGVSLVHRGANRKRFAFFKSEEGQEMEEDEILEAVVKTATDDEQRLESVMKDKEMSKKARSAMKGMLRIANAFKDELPDDMLHLLAELSGRPEPKKKKDGDKDEDMKAGKKAKSAKKKEEGTMQEEKVEAKKSLDDMPAEVKAQIDGLWKKNKEAVEKAEQLEAVLKAERNERRKKEFIEKASKEYSHIPGESIALAEIIKSAYDSSETLGKAFEQILAGAEKAISAGAVFEEAGTSATQEGGDAWGRIEKAAQEVVVKSGDKMTKAAAVDFVMRNQPELYNEYLKENTAQSGWRA